MPEEHVGQLGFEYAWKELLARTRQAGTGLPLSKEFNTDSFHRRLPHVQHLHV